MSMVAFHQGSDLVVSLVKPAELLELLDYLARNKQALVCFIMQVYWAGHW